MNTDDLISVLVPAYNHERYIEECIRSIMAQTYQNIELLVIDDGSTDGTFEILQSLKPECEKRFVRVVFETQENSGTCVTLNRLFDTAQGEYLYVTASDDVAKLNAVETLYTSLANNPDCVLAVGDNELINAKSERIFLGKNREILPENEAVYKTFGDALHINSNENRHSDFGSYEDLLKGNYIPNGYLMRKDAVLAVGKYNPDIILEDWYMNLQLAKKGKFKYIPEILFSYRQHGANTVSSTEFRSKALKIFRRIYEHEKEYCFTNGYKELWSYQWRKHFGWRTKWRNFRKGFFRINLKKRIVVLFGITFCKGTQYDD